MSNTVTSSLMVEVAVCVSSLNLLWAYLTFCFVPLPAFTYSAAFFQFNAIIKSLSFCEAFTSSKVLACSVL
ncbi:hypothetical protein D3C85_1392440 [compost metagenome]